jgi:DNA-directed RNA polymerase subunit N (RpoN/RPB10)
MLIPVLCFTCGCPIGDKEDIFNYLKKETKRKDNEDFSDILELLDIKNDCCKMHFISSMLITDYY